jgi:hypothetical protein
MRTSHCDRFPFMGSSHDVERVYIHLVFTSTAIWDRYDFSEISWWSKTLEILIPTKYYQYYTAGNI